jgi:hypothetical protein
LNSGVKFFQRKNSAVLHVGDSLPDRFMIGIVSQCLQRRSVDEKIELMRLLVFDRHRVAAVQVKGFALFVGEFRSHVDTIARVGFAQLIANRRFFETYRDMKKPAAKL